MTRKTRKAAEVFHADVDSGGERVRLVARFTYDGWQVAIRYLATKEWSVLCVLPECEDAKEAAEDFARNILKVKDEIVWSASPPDPKNSEGPQKVGIFRRILSRMKGR
jgi:hypothetical protein